jgi:hypothetical protein
VEKEHGKPGELELTVRAVGGNALRDFGAAMALDDRAWTRGDGRTSVSRGCDEGRKTCREETGHRR